MKKALMIIAMIAIVVIAGSLVYYFVFFRPGIEKAEIMLQEQKLELEQKEKEKITTDEALRKENLEKCLKESQDWYDKALGSVADIKGATLEEQKMMIQLIENMYKEKINACNMKYGK